MIDHHRDPRCVRTGEGVDFTEDPRIEQYERERAEAIDIAHRAMRSSYIGAPPPGLRGDADRMVAALLAAGWTPPGAQATEYAEVGAKTYRRRVIVVEDWTELPRG